MAPAVASKSRTDRESTSPNPSAANTATRSNLRRNGTSVIVEESQDIKDSNEGRKFLEKHLLLCPPGEPPTHTSLATCLHQISAMSGLQKQAINAIRSVAFLLDELEETQINLTVKEAFDSQISEFTSDMQTLIADAREKLDSHIKSAEERLSQATAANAVNAAAAPQATHFRAPVNPSTYASVLINPPAHANPRIAAREGIKARQFAIRGIKNSKFSHLDNLKLKAEINKIVAGLGLPSGKIRSVLSTRNGETIVEADSDEAANWLLVSENQRKICAEIGANAEFRARAFNIIAFNVPIALDPNNADHILEICEANNLDLEPATITAAKWAKAIDKRSPDQRTAHLLLTFNNADSANRVITNGLILCNRKCRVEKTKREPVRCLKCQGWNHFARECMAEHDKCGNCAGNHRTNSCTTPEKKCVSCNSDDHASWSRTCPVFLKKMDEFDMRNPDNSLQFFPTSDPWTWTSTETPRPAAPVRPALQSQTQAQNRPSNTQLGKRPQRSQQQQTRACDTYIPDYSSREYLAQVSAKDWWDDHAGPSRPSNLSSQQFTENGPGAGTTTTDSQPSRPSNPLNINA